MKHAVADVGRRARSPLWPLVGALALCAAGCGTLSIQEEKELGRKAQREIRENVQLVRDPVTVGYVRDFGERLVDASPPSPFDFRFYVVEDEDINAFAVPGGAVYVNTGLILAVRDAAELASVLSHEIGHVTERHVAEIVKPQRNINVVGQVLYVLVGILTGSPYIQQAGGMATQMAAQAYMSTYTQEAENEADALAIQTMVHAGWDPNAMVSMFEMLEQEYAGSYRMPSFLASHPAPAERIEHVSAEIKALGALPGLRRDDGGKIEIIQRRLELIIGTDIEDLLTDDEE